uniref:Uncharacterized protein n=1 Tax=viral metagenome TaxID=1070528 RepID=A0A6C0IYV1_9ZZZZ
MTPKSSLSDPRYRQYWYPDDSFYPRPINGVWQFDIVGRQPTLQFIANSGQEADEVIDDYTELSNLLARNV